MSDSHALAWGILGPRLRLRGGAIGVDVAQLARVLERSQSTTHRVLLALVADGLLVRYQRGTRRRPALYSAGPRAWLDLPTERESLAAERVAVRELRGRRGA